MIFDKTNLILRTYLVTISNKTYPMHFVMIDYYFINHLQQCELPFFDLLLDLKYLFFCEFLDEYVNSDC